MLEIYLLYNSQKQCFRLNFSVPGSHWNLEENGYYTFYQRIQLYTKQIVCCMCKLMQWDTM